MAVVNFKKLKEVAEKAKETHLIDLGLYVDNKLKDVVVPVRVKSIEECIKFKEDYKLKSEDLVIKYKQFKQLPKGIKEEYRKSDEFRKGDEANTYVQYVEFNSDESKLKRRAYRERLFNILIHFDMDYKTDEGKTLWEDAGLEINDYDGLINIFSDIIKYENHLDILDLVIDQIKNGNVEEHEINIVIYQYKLRKVVEGFDTEEEKKSFIEAYNEQVKEAQKTIGDRIAKEKSEVETVE